MTTLQTDKVDNVPHLTMKECWRCEAKHERVPETKWRSTHMGRVWQRKLGQLCESCWQEYLKHDGRFKYTVKKDRIDRILREMGRYSR